MNPTVAIIGAGISGICAALSAAENGCQVFLIERSKQVGGVATHANVGTFCGAFQVRKQVPKLVGNSRVRDFLKDLMKYIDAEPLEHVEDLYVIPYRYEKLQAFLTQKCTHDQIHLLTDTVVNDVEVSKELISKLFLNKSGHLTELEVDAVVDCTGNAVIARRIGHPVLENKVYQSASRVFYADNVASNNERTLQLFLTLAQQKIIHPDLRKKVLQCSILPGSLTNGKVGIKVNLPWDVNDMSENKEYYLYSSEILIYEIFQWLQDEIPSFKNSKITKVFGEIGFRSSARTKGKAILKREDLSITYDKEKHIAIGTWPIEKWDFEGRVSIELKEIVRTGYGIPSGCIESCYIENLFMAGKNISADEDAIASARVMGTCIQTGFAAGKVAALSNALVYTD